ncbi:MAG TPA: FtsX-like permease family protein [Natronosporangium sp.]
MGRILLVCRLAVRDLRRRPAEAALLLLAITTATTALTLGSVLHGVTSEPYQATREATAGPDVVASVAPAGDGRPADVASLRALAEAPGVVAASGPYPYGQTIVEANGVTATAWTQGRDTDPVRVDQPALTDGTWVHDGGAVLEAGFAAALGVGAGDQITVDGESFRVAGVAVTAAADPYPKVCFAPCRSGETLEDVPEDLPVDPADLPGGPGGTSGPPAPSPAEPPVGPPISEAFPLGAAGIVGPSGLLWLTEADARGLFADQDSLGYVVNLALADPAGASEFVDAHGPQGAAAVEPAAPTLATWTSILGEHDRIVEQKRVTLLVGSWLLSGLAVASIVVLVGGRLADRLRRVGLLKAVGGSPSLIAAVLLAEHAAVALLAAAAGLTVGRVTAPLLTEPGASLLGRAGEVPFTLATIGLVVAVALGIAGLATLVPALRAARTTTASALADTARPPRRMAWLIAMSARMPTPLLLAVRVAARRPRRTLLGIVGIAITVTGIVAALAAHAHRAAERAPGADPRTELSEVLLLITVMLVVQAAVNAICIVWATTIDAKRSSALARVLGATPGQVSVGLSVAQMLPALAGALLGLAGGIGLAEFLDDDAVTIPPVWQLIALLLGCVLVIAALTATPARIGARRPAMEVLHGERP